MWTFAADWLDLIEVCGLCWVAWFDLGWVFMVCLPLQLRCLAWVYSLYAFCVIAVAGFEIGGYVICCKRFVA